VYGTCLNRSFPITILEIELPTTLQYCDITLKIIAMALAKW